MSWVTARNRGSLHNYASGRLREGNGLNATAIESRAVTRISMNRALRYPIPLVVMLLALMLRGRPDAAHSAAGRRPDFQAYSRFDFVPGEKIVGFEDFSQDSIGDFPAKWNTNAAGEIVTIAGKPGRWLKLTRAGGSSPS